MLQNILQLIVLLRVAPMSERARNERTPTGGVCLDHGKLRTPALQAVATQRFVCQIGCVIKFLCGAPGNQTTAKRLIAEASESTPRRDFG
jgi:hypothetical protein